MSFPHVIIHYLEENVKNHDIYITYNDGCAYQNRNAILPGAISYFCSRNNKIIEYKYLEKGHSQMEMDSTHSIIKRYLKYTHIFVPMDYINVFKRT